MDALTEFMANFIAVVENLQRQMFIVNAKNEILSQKLNKAIELLKDNGNNGHYKLRQRWLSVNEVSHYVGISRNTVMKYRQEFGGKKVAGGWKFKRELVDNYLENGG